MHGLCVSYLIYKWKPPPPIFYLLSNLDFDILNNSYDCWARVQVTSNFSLLTEDLMHCMTAEIQQVQHFSL